MEKRNNKKVISVIHYHDCNLAAQDAVDKRFAEDELKLAPAKDKFRAKACLMLVNDSTAAVSVVEPIINCGIRKRYCNGKTL